MSKLNYTEEDMEKIFNELLKEQINKENKEKELFLNKYENCFNAIIFNCHSWGSDQNLYSNLPAFEEIDNLVYIISDFAIKYHSINNIAYVKWNDYLFSCEHFYGQGSFSRITFLDEEENEEDIKKINKNDIINIEKLIDWVKNTDKWRMFQKKDNKKI